jgi:16S rRNA (uracil1498-N3)-methyltransferase
MELHRFFLPEGGIAADTVVFSAEQSHQIRSVLRLRPGAQVIALDGSGMELVVRLDEVADRVTGVVEDRQTSQAEPRTRVVLYCSLLKAAKFETILQKGTEIGVAAFVPVHTARSILPELSASKQRRYETVVREAAEQSRRGLLPCVAPTLSFAEAVRDAVADGPGVLLWEEESSRRLRDLTLGPAGTVSLLVGPEGGLTVEEAELARQAGATSVTLGPRVLRAETAAVVGAALVLARLGDFG